MYLRRGLCHYKSAIHRFEGGPGLFPGNSIGIAWEYTDISYAYTKSEILIMKSLIIKYSVLFITGDKNMGPKLPWLPDDPLASTKRQPQRLWLALGYRKTGIFLQFRGLI